MRILYSVQRYGEEIVGGSEAACRAFAEALVAAGHQVEVVTSCAKDYVTWSNFYPVGSSTINGVIVHRLPVIGPRDPEVFGPLDRRLMTGTSRAMNFENRRWAQHMGPNLEDHVSWLLDNYQRFDAAIFMTYLYATSTTGILALAGRLPIIFQPTAHTEPALRANIFETVFKSVDAYLFFTPEEQEIVSRRFRFTPRGLVAGIGIDTSPPVASIQDLPERLQPKRPYLVYVGRIDPMKGVRELIGFYSAMRNRSKEESLDLVLVGEQITDLDLPQGVTVTGYLEPSEKNALIRGSLALVQSSYFESFSIVICEAWVQSRPVLVQGRCSVLRGQVDRSRGGIAYEGFAEFEEATKMLDDTQLNQQLGGNGRKYVEAQYRWETVIARVEAAVDLATQAFTKRRR